MSCNRYHYEMSLSLDGRLSNGRRKLLLAHLDECADCDELWAEMRRAQELALQLPAQTVGTDFRDGLFERIQSGEGSPEAVFKERVPVAAKARYLLTGAAAAALLIAGFRALVPADEPAPENARLVAADDGARDGSRSGRLAPVQSSQVSPTPARLTSGFAASPFDRLSVADLGRRRFVDGVTDLKQFVGRIRTEIEPATFRVREFKRRLDRREPIRRAQGSAELMWWLHEQRMVVLPPDFQAELKTLDSALRLLRGAKSAVDVRAAVEQIDALDPARVPQEFSVVCCDKPEEFLQRFLFRFHTNRDVLHLMGAPLQGVLHVHIIQPEQGRPGRNARAILVRETDH